MYVLLGGGVRKRPYEICKSINTYVIQFTAVNGDQPYHAQKQDLIEELKLSKDITGIKKMKVERVKLEEQQEKEIVSEISKQLSANSFVDKVSNFKLLRFFILLLLVHPVFTRYISSNTGSKQLNGKQG